jgi:integrase
VDKFLRVNPLGTDEIETEKIKASQSFADSRLNLFEVMEDVIQARQIFEGSGLSSNTLHSYRIALAHWSAWLQLRYDRALTAGPLREEIVVQFVLDHLGRPQEDGSFEHQLPQHIDQLLVTSGIKAELGALSHNTVKQRVNVLSSWCRHHGSDNPCLEQAVKKMMKRARIEQEEYGIKARQKTVATTKSLKALLATCTDGIRGIRDRAILLLAWHGGRRRSAVANLMVSEFHKSSQDAWVYVEGDSSSTLNDEAGEALSNWLKAAAVSDGVLFRGLLRGSKVSAKGLTGHTVARMIQERARLAGLEGDWGAHSLRAGFITESANQGVPLKDILAVTRPMSATAILRYVELKE